MNESNYDVSTETRFVRVTGIRKNAFVEFDFSIDDPTLFVELVLPFSQFKQFCDRNNVQEMTTEQKLQVDLDKMKWRYGQPGVDQ